LPENCSKRPVPAYSGTFTRCAHVGVSDADRPYRPHLPHPEKAWLWGWAEEEIVGPPSLPGDGELIMFAA
jgi:hypothetical protein